MSKLSRDEINYISFAISMLGLFFIIIGVFPIILPLIIVGMIVMGFEGLISAILFPPTIILMQARILYLMIKSIRNRGYVNQKSGKIISIVTNTYVLSIINLFFVIAGLLFSLSFKYFPIPSILLIIAPIITIISGFIFKDY